MYALSGANISGKSHENQFFCVNIFVIVVIVLQCFECGRYVFSKGLFFIPNKLRMVDLHSTYS